MSGNQGLVEISMAASVSWVRYKETCRLVPDYYIYLIFLMYGLEDVRLSMLQKSTKRVAGKGHWRYVIRIDPLLNKPRRRWQ